MNLKFTRILVFFALFCQFFATQSPAQQNSPFDDLLDSRRKGLFAGGGVAYGSTQFRASHSAGELRAGDGDALATLGGTSGGLQWRLGYATSENTAFYVTSFAADLAPSLGVLMFSEKYQGYYLNVLVGYSNYEVPGTTLPNFVQSEEGTSLTTWSFGAGFGYEFRPHFMIEFMAGYSRLTIPDGYYDFDWSDGKWHDRSSDLYLDRITFFASFNYMFY